MDGSVEYFVNYFKASIMNNVVAENPCTLSDYYQELRDCVVDERGDAEKKALFLHNIEKAYKIVGEEIFGMEEKRYGD
ncbi:hypothetical protein CHN50_10115 [Priestia aryabhattai]|uniref:hypothetical protein n=1 Tax=Priestia TaxID=2800373 RepID=UPI000BA163EA|nr:hypothetical protein [Priestia flexa]MBY6023549.1 hypothetical protein [Nitratireductor sp. DP7N14-4]MDT2048359.1 hypothetical protein [Priestia flexa]OZT12774.1 hypothetical protein CHN50_10115 [Priestia aryabhattai]USY55559.1 hypothetical protein NIZ91_02420 [Bacillus sp. 1780r2a1]